MFRDGRRAPPLASDEKEAVFEAVSAGDNRQKALSRIKRNRTTILRLYNVVAQFERRGIASLDTNTAQEIAEAAKYSATPRYVHNEFLRWKSWKERRKACEASPDSKPSHDIDELEALDRELFHFARRVRDRLGVDQPQVAVGTALIGQTELWIGRAPLQQPSARYEERLIEQEWGAQGSRLDSKRHRLFPLLRHCLEGNPCWTLLDTAEKAIRNYSKLCQEAYESIKTTVTANLPAKTDSEAEYDHDVDAIVFSLLLFALYRCKSLSQVEDSGDRDWERPPTSCAQMTEGSGGEVRRSLVLPGPYQAGRHSGCERLKLLEDVYRKLAAEVPTREGLRAVEQAYRKALAAVKAFQQELSPDERLRRLIVEGRR